MAHPVNVNKDPSQRKVGWRLNKKKNVVRSEAKLATGGIEATTFDAGRKTMMIMIMMLLLNNSYHKSKKQFPFDMENFLLTRPDLKRKCSAEGLNHMYY